MTAGLLAEGNGHEQDHYKRNASVQDEKVHDVFGMQLPPTSEDGE